MMRTTPRMKSPKAGDGTFPSSMMNGEFGPNSMPNSSGRIDGTGGRSPKKNPELRNRNTSKATAAARVMMARLAPRTRNAGMATRSPKNMAIVC